MGQTTDQLTTVQTALIVLMEWAKENKYKYREISPTGNYGICALTPDLNMISSVQLRSLAALLGDAFGFYIDVQKANQMEIRVLKFTFDRSQLPY